MLYVIYTHIYPKKKKVIPDNNGVWFFFTWNPFLLKVSIHRLCKVVLFFLLFCLLNYILLMAPPHIHLWCRFDVASDPWCRITSLYSRHWCFQYEPMSPVSHHVNVTAVDYTRLHQQSDATSMASFQERFTECNDR